jgi:hypothetical protein
MPLRQEISITVSTICGIPNPVIVTTVVAMADNAKEIKKFLGPQSIIVSISILLMNIVIGGAKGKKFKKQNWQ